MTVGNGDNGGKTPPENGSGGRDGQTGRFVQGNKCSPGRKRIPKSSDFRNAISQSIDPELLVKVIQQMGQMASHGNLKAAEIFLKWTIGRPPESLALHLQDKTTFDDVIGEMDHFMGR